MNTTRKLQKYLLFIFLLLLFTIEAPIIAVGYITTPSVSDVIIVLGAKLVGQDPSTMLRLRLDEAIKLYNKGYAPIIIVSGAQGSDEEISEAEA